MFFPFYVKNDFMPVKKTAGFKSRHLVAEYILLGRLGYARVTIVGSLRLKKWPTTARFVTDAKLGTNDP